ncbi:hypothetical protein INT47_004986 [Mucor saturninus]|uniref:G-patch domain-containing protein n=1 Tax=Mucor saturninus TaxID=64648 RepID=A0A8H7QSX9_9FUNG|nr:hypothetical protein INT47_004986 [Mucor saturninus]
MNEPTRNDKEEELPIFEEVQPKSTIMSRYVRPIEFILEGSDPPEKVEKRQKVASNGDEVASIYRSIISAVPKTMKRKVPVAVSEKPSVDTIWCESCSMLIDKSDYKRHIQGTAHMVSNQSEPAPDLLNLSGRNVGFKMMKSQGWNYEDGLGPEGQGRRHPIATVLKQDRLCIGHEETGRKAVTHKYKEIEKKAIARQRMDAQNKKDPGKEIARKAKAESERRVAILRYMKG